MSCQRCGKTVYAAEETKSSGFTWHTACFKCMGPSDHGAEFCGITLNLKSVNAFEGKIYCKTHVPRPKATQVADSVMTEHAKAAQSTKSLSKEAQKSHATMEEKDTATTARAGQKLPLDDEEFADMLKGASQLVHVKTAIKANRFTCDQVTRLVKKIPKEDIAIVKLTYPELTDPENFDTMLMDIFKFESDREQLYKELNVKRFC